MLNIKTIWNMQSVQQHKRYLGLPSLVGRAQSSTFQELKSKVWN